MQAIDTFENRVSSRCRTVGVFPGFQCLYHKQITITFLLRWNSVILNISWILDNTTILAFSLSGDFVESGLPCILCFQV